MGYGIKQTPIDENKPYKLSDICKLLDVSEPTVRNLLTTGALKGIKVGKQWRISRQNFNEFING